MTLDKATLEAALIGYQHERERIEGEIAALRKRLGQRAAGDGDIGAPQRRRRMSASARKRIAAAQKARWAAYRKKQAS